MRQWEEMEYQLKEFTEVETNQNHHRTGRELQGADMRLDILGMTARP